MDICTAFADRLAADWGIHVNPTELIADGKMHRITPDGDRRHSKALAYKIHDDASPVGWFEYHKTGDKGSIPLGERPRLSPAEQAEARKRWAEQRARAEAEQVARQDDRAAVAAQLWAAALPATGHPYLDRKGITSAATVRACTLKMAEFLDNEDDRRAEPDALLVPLYSRPGVIRSLQAILADGSKLFLSGGQTGACYHPIKGTDPSRVLVCEGYATGAALAVATGHSVVCAMSAKNLPAVARIVAEQAKGREVVICADNDHGTEAKRGRNPGIDAGREAAQAIGARVVWPTGCEGTDWDDWLREGGDPEILADIVSGKLEPAGAEREGTSARGVADASDAGMVPARDSAIAIVPEANSVQRIRADLDSTVPPDLNLPAKYSEDNAAIAFAHEAERSFRYVKTWGKWMVWDGARWKDDETDLHMDSVRIMCRAICDAIRMDQIEFTTEAKRNRAIATYGNYRTMKNIEALARADRTIAARANQWDSDLWLLNTPGGVVDLRTGQLRAARRDDYMTRITAAAPQGDCPAWREFLNVATDGDVEMQSYLQRLAGYCLTGEVTEQMFAFIYGTGGNGKGTFITTLTKILGDYAQPANMELLTERKGDDHPTALAGLQGARLVSAQETEEGKRWAEARIKSLTGGDLIRARYMRQDEFTFMPQFKLLIAGNHKPGLKNVDDAIKRRLHLIPFTVTIPPEKKDPNLPAKLLAEADGIMAWAVEGCAMWRETGLKPPQRVLAATEEYLEQQDVLGGWIDDCCVVLPAVSSRSSALYASFKQWAETAGEYVMPQKRWVAALESRGFRSVKSTGVMVYRGIGIKDDGFGKPSSW